MNHDEKSVSSPGTTLWLTAQAILYEGLGPCSGTISFTSIDIAYCIDTDCQEGGIWMHITSAKKIHFSFFFPCQQEEKNRCMLNIAPLFCLLTAAAALPRSQGEYLPGVWGSCGSDYGWTDGSFCQGAPWHAAVAPPARPTGALRTCRSLSVHRR